MLVTLFGRAEGCAPISDCYCISIRLFVKFCGSVTRKLPVSKWSGQAQLRQSANQYSYKKLFSYLYKKFSFWNQRINWKLSFPSDSRIFEFYILLPLKMTWYLIVNSCIVGKCLLVCMHLVIFHLCYRDRPEILLSGLVLVLVLVRAVHFAFASQGSYKSTA